MANRVQRALQIDRVLTNLYIQYFKKIKRDKAFPWDLTTLKTTYNDEIYQKTRKAVTEVYMVGAQYAGNVLRKDVYPGDTDLGIIKDDTNRGVFSFWKRIEEDSKRVREQELAEERKLKDRETESMLGTVSDVLIFGALALSTISKADQLSGAQKPKVKWVTAGDGKTCPLCKRLNGMTWDADDPFIPTPGRLGSDGTHPNCRCYVELII